MSSSRVKKSVRRIAAKPSGGSRLTAPAGLRLAGGGPVRWARQAALGFFRSAVLVVLTAAVPAVAAAVGFFGSVFTLSWNGEWRAPLAVLVPAVAGELALALWWTIVATTPTVFWLGPPIQPAGPRACRGLAGDPDRGALPAGVAAYPDGHRLLVERLRVSQVGAGGAQESLDGRSSP